MVCLSLLAVVLLRGIEAAAQADTIEVVLPPVTVEASRSAETSATAPFAVTLMTRSATDVSVESATSLQDVLASVPGIWLNDRGHFAMGERIILRGTGWRSAFGVRGVMVVLDGVPLTMPDGQAFADVVEPALIRSAEVIRGPSSVFWGNASGGVLYLKTVSAAAAPGVRVRGLVGSHGERQLLGEARFAVGRGSASVFASHIGRDGYRAHSGGEFQRGGGHLRLPVGGRTVVNLSIAGALQDALNPGGLTAQQISDDRLQVDSVYIRNGAGKESVQLQGIASVDHALPFATLSAAAYGVRRDLDNPLTGRYVVVDRLAGGGRLRLSGEPGSRIRWSVGGDVGRQSDDRQNFENLGGEPGTDPDLDQIETVTNVAGYGYTSVSLASNLELSVGLRADAIEFEMDDRYLENGDQSGDRNFTAVSPTAGLSYRHGNTIVFANYATAFETPTTTELVNRPDLTGGFNPTLRPEYARGVEVGVRGAVPSAASLAYEIALFRTTVDDILVQQQTEDGRDYYRNAGVNRHVGAEAFVTVRPLQPLTLQASYALNDLRFVDGALADNVLPGVPRHRGFARLVWESPDFRLAASVESVSGYFADERNAAETDGYTVFTLSASHPGISVSGGYLRPFVEIENVFDAAYNASVVVNAFGGRYYEPAPGRVIRAGLNIGI